MKYLGAEFKNIKKSKFMIVPNKIYSTILFLFFLNNLLAQELTINETIDYINKKLVESSDNAEETTTTKSSDTTALIIIVNLLFIAVATIIIVLFNNKNKLEIMDKLEEMDSVKKTKKGAKNEA